MGPTQRVSAYLNGRTLAVAVQGRLPLGQVWSADLAIRSTPGAYSCLSVMPGDNASDRPAGMTVAPMFAAAIRVA